MTSIDDAGSAFPPALSFTENPEMKELFERVTQAQYPLTIVCGAGVSRDAGLPTWKQLIESLAEGLPEELQDWIHIDEMDLMRKTSLLQALLPRHESFAESISRVLYRTFDGEPRPGLLARAIAEFVHATPNKLTVRIATTNFDDLLERALSATSGRSCYAVPLENSDDWRNARKGSRVLHLHGALLSDCQYSGAHESGDTRTVIGNPILSESDFLQYGNRVQNEVKKILKESDVVFVGLSMTDPNIVGPLHATMPKRPNQQSPSKGHRFFVVNPTDPPAKTQGLPLNSETDRQFQRYNRIKTKALADHLRLVPVMLNAYSQTPQLFIELGCATKAPARYMKATSNVRYGRRLVPLLKTLHDLVGLPTSDLGEWDGGLQRILSVGLQRDLDKFVRPRLRDIAHAHDISNALGHTTKDDLKSEKFGLFLWLRSLPNSDGTADYSLTLAGSSTYLHSEHWSMARTCVASASSRYWAGRAAYFGNAIAAQVESGQAHNMWSSYLATPISRVVGPGEVTYGVVTLNSTLPFIGDSPTSILSKLSGTQVSEIAKLLNTTMLEALTVDPK